MIGAAVSPEVASGFMWVQIATVITVVAGFINQSLKEKRARRWLVEDREAASQSREALADKVDVDSKALLNRLTLLQSDLVSQVRHTAGNVSNTVSLSKELLVALLENNTKISEKAFSEANHVNMKIAELTAALGATSRHTGEMVKNVETTGKDTNVAVHRVEAVVGSGVREPAPEPPTKPEPEPAEQAAKAMA